MPALPPEPFYRLLDESHKGIFSLQSMENPYLLTGMGDGSVIEWNCHSGSSRIPITSEENTPAIGIEYFNETLFIQSKNGLINSYKPALEYAHFSGINTNYMGFCKIKVSPDKGGLLGCPSKDYLEILNINDFQSVIKLRSKDTSGFIMDFKFLNFDNAIYILVTYESGQLSLWDLRTIKELSKISFNNNSMVIDYDSEHDIGFQGNPTNLIHCFKMNKLSLVKHHDIKITNNGISFIKIRPDKKIVTMASWDNRLRIFSLKKLRPLAVLEGHKKTIQEIIYTDNYSNFGNNKSIMISACLEGKILFWDIYNK